MGAWSNVFGSGSNNGSLWRDNCGKNSMDTKKGAKYKADKARQERAARLQKEGNKRGWW